MLDKMNFSEENTLLVLIDYQERIMPAMDRSEEVIDNTSILLNGANTIGLPVIYSEQYPKGLGSTVEKIKQYIPETVDYIEKKTFSAYPKMIDFLKKHNRKNIIIAGCETHVCLFQTVQDLLSQNYNVIVASDCCSSRKECNSLNALELMREMGAVISNNEMILFKLLKSADNTNFKAISNIVK